VTSGLSSLGIVIAKDHKEKKYFDDTIMRGLSLMIQDTEYAETSPQLKPPPGLPQVAEWNKGILPAVPGNGNKARTTSDSLQGVSYDGEYLRKRNDFELIDLTIKGARAAFEVLVERYKNSIYGLAFRMLRNHEDAADISQDVFLKAYEALTTFKKKSSFHTWLYRIATNSCINYLRKQTAQQEVELATYHAARQADTLDSLYKIELQDVVNTAIDRLPEKQKATVILRVCEGLSHREVSKQLCCSVGTAKANYFHAIRNLRRFMKNYIAANMDIPIPVTIPGTTHSL
jgi:RNA polymerase sigma-70 factor (ECF subfamily)